MSNYENNIERTDRLESAYKKLKENQKVILLMGLSETRAAAEEALINYFVGAVDADWFEANSKEGAMNELKELVKDLKDEQS